MRMGDFLLASSHSYPEGWSVGEVTHRWEVPTPVIFVSEFSEGDFGGRKFYVILTPTGLHTINSAFCREV